LIFLSSFSTGELRRKPPPPLAVQKEIVALMENIEKQIHKEQALAVQLSQFLSHLENYQKIN